MCSDIRHLVKTASRKIGKGIVEESGSENEVYWKMEG
jgi:hypothetical protein